MVKTNEGFSSFDVAVSAVFLSIFVILRSYKLHEKNILSMKLNDASRAETFKNNDRFLSD